MTYKVSEVTVNIANNEEQDFCPLENRTAGEVLRAVECLFPHYTSLVITVVNIDGIDRHDPE